MASQAAIEAEVTELVVRHDQPRDEAGKRLVVRNGHLPARELLTGAGKLEVQSAMTRGRVSTRSVDVSDIGAILVKYADIAYFGWRTSR